MQCHRRRALPSAHFGEGSKLAAHFESPSCARISTGIGVLSLSSANKFGTCDDCGLDSGTDTSST